MCISVLCKKRKTRKGALSKALQSCQIWHLCQSAHPSPGSTSQATVHKKIISIPLSCTFKYGFTSVRKTSISGWVGVRSEEIQCLRKHKSMQWMTHAQLTSSPHEKWHSVTCFCFSLIWKCLSGNSRKRIISIHVSCRFEDGITGVDKCSMYEKKIMQKSIIH